MQKITKFNLQMILCKTQRKFQLLKHKIVKTFKVFMQKIKTLLHHFVPINKQSNNWFYYSKNIKKNEVMMQTVKISKVFNLQILLLKVLQIQIHASMTTVLVISTIERIHRLWMDKHLSSVQWQEKIQDVKCENAQRNKNNANNERTAHPHRT